jgi:hypothetical protein
LHALCKFLHISQRGGEKQAYIPGSLCEARINRFDNKERLKSTFPGENQPMLAAFPVSLTCFLQMW